MVFPASPYVTRVRCCGQAWRFVRPNRGLPHREEQQRARTGKQATTTQWPDRDALCTITLTLNRLYSSPMANMAESMSHLSPEKMTAHTDSIIIDSDMDMACHDAPSSPFMDHIEIVTDDQENIAPNAVRTPVKPLVDFDDNIPQSAFRASPEKRFGLKERTSPMKTSPMKNLLDDYEDAEPRSSASTPKKTSTPVRTAVRERSESLMSSRSQRGETPSKSSYTPSASVQRKPSIAEHSPSNSITPSKRPASSPLKQRHLRDNEGLTAAMKFMDEAPIESRETSARPSSRDYNDDVDFGMDNTDFNPDGPEPTSLDFDDTCFSFSEMPGIDMTKFASLKQSPTKSEAPDVSSLLRKYQQYRKLIISTGYTSRPHPDDAFHSPPRRAYA